MTPLQPAGVPVSQGQRPKHDPSTGSDAQRSRLTCRRISSNLWTFFWFLLQTVEQHQQHLVLEEQRRRPGPGDQWFYAEAQLWTDHS